MLTIEMHLHILQWTLCISLSSHPRTHVVMLVLRSTCQVNSRKEEIVHVKPDVAKEMLVLRRKLNREMLMDRKYRRRLLVIVWAADQVFD